MSSQIEKYRVFIASPGGLQEERRVFRDVIQQYNESDALPAGLMFEPVGWEETLGGFGRPQSLINDEVRTCDYLVLLLWDRWGTNPGKDGHPYSSGTEEEYHVALECLEDANRPMQKIVAIFKAIDPRQRTDPGEQLKKVLEFQQRLESQKTLLYHTFDSREAFCTVLRRHLAQWRRDHDGKASTLPQPEPLIPDIAVDFNHGMSPPIPATQDTSAESSVLDEADRLTNEGKLVEAEDIYAAAAIGGKDADALIRYGNFLSRLGRLNQAETMYGHVATLADRQNQDQWRAAALGNLGLIYRTRGELDKAEEMHRKSLKINEQLGWLEGMASDYGNLGLICITRGELDKAEELHRKSLKINEQLGRLEGMASDYGNLGLIYRTRGELDKAEEMHRKSLKINEQLGCLERIASDYGNLGLICGTRGELDKAEEMHHKSLKINEKLGRLEGVAIQYGNLGLIYRKRGELDKAEEMHQKALEINEKLGTLEGTANQYGNLGLIYMTRGELHKAEELLHKALEIDEKLGRLEGIASAYGNLGAIYITREELDKAEELLRKSLKIEEQLGRLEGVANGYANLGLVEQERDRPGEAKALWEKAVELYRRIGMPHMIEQVQGWIDELDGGDGAGAESPGKK